jgi:hypothetical protein
MEPILAARGSNLIKALMEGDPVAWIIVGAVVVVGIGLQIWKNKKAKKEKQNN